MSVSIPAKRFASYIKLIPGIESMDESDIVKKFDEFEKAAGALRKAEKTRLESLSEEERAAEKEMKKKEAADKKQAEKAKKEAEKDALKAKKDADKAEKAKKAAEREAKLRAEKGDEAYEAAKAKRIASLAKAREAKKRMSGNAEPAEEVEKQEEKQEEETEKPNEKQLIYDEIGDGSDEEEPPKITNSKSKKTSKPKVNKSAK